MTLGKMIRSIREEELGITQGELAVALSISDAYVSQLEGGKRTAELRYKDDIYWGIARIASRGGQKQCFDLYCTLVGLDMEWRNPMIYEVLGRHFYHRFVEEGNEVTHRVRQQARPKQRRSKSHRRASNF